MHADGAGRDRRIPPRGRSQAVGGLSDDTLAEDTDLTMALCRAGWRVVYEESAMAWTEAPVDAAAAVAAAVPLVLRHDAGDVEAPARGDRAWPRAAVSAAAACPTSPSIRVAAAAAARPRSTSLALYGDLRARRAGDRPVVARVVALSRSSRAAHALRIDGESSWVMWGLPLQQFVYRQLMYLVVDAVRWSPRWSAPGCAGTAIRRTGTFSHANPALSQPRI